MKQEAHTPGPWQVGRSCDGPAVTVPVPASEGSGFLVAHINRLPRMGSVRGDMEANARLIAAAPEMLEALRCLVEAIDFEGEDGSIRFNPGSPFELDSLRAARAAIAKAEGQS